MKKIIRDKKGCIQLISNDTYFADIWFNGVNIVEEAMAEGVDYCGTVKISHKGFPPSTSEFFTK